MRSFSEAWWRGPALVLAPVCFPRTRPQWNNLGDTIDPKAVIQAAQMNRTRAIAKAKTNAYPN